MPPDAFRRLPLAAVLVGGLLVATFAVLLLRSQAALRHEIRRTIIERDAAVLHPVVLEQLAEAMEADSATIGYAQLSTVLRSARQQGMLAVAVFDAQGELVRSVPGELPFVDLPVDDYLELTRLQPISRYHPAFALNEVFPGLAPAHRFAPVLEVLLPLHTRDARKLAGVARYTIDASPLAAELAAIDQRLDRQTATTLALAALIVAGIVTGAYLVLRRAQRIIAERNTRLVRANFDLTLATKASAVGQIASHLIHGLQGPVAGLRAAVAGGSSADWENAAGYTERMQQLIQETVGFLADTRHATSYDLTLPQLAESIRARNTPAALAKEVALRVTASSDEPVDNHRGGLLCLIVSNLVQNAIAATPAGREIVVALHRQGPRLVARVSDDGPGIPTNIRAHLFEPGRTGREGGTGLGLAISRLLARQIDAALELESSGPDGTVFRLTVPLDR